MAHFAQLNDENRVINVIVIDNAILLDSNKEEQENLGIEYCQNLFGSNSKWIQTSYNSQKRGKFASVGDLYDEQQNIFIYDNNWHNMKRIENGQMPIEIIE